MSEKTAEKTEGFVVTVTGQYLRGSRMNRVIKLFNHKFWLPKLEFSDHRNALGMIRDELLPRRISKTDDEYFAVRTCMIIDTEPLGANKQVYANVSSKPIGAMSIGELLDFCQLKQYPIQPANFGTVMEARKAVKAHVDSLELEDARRAIQDKKVQETNQLLEDNGLIEDLDLGDPLDEL